MNVLTDVVALATLAVAAYAYHKGDAASGALVLAALAGFYFGNRTSGPGPGGSGMV